MGLADYLNKKNTDMEKVATTIAQKIYASNKEGIEIEKVASDYYAGGAIMANGFWNQLVNLEKKAGITGTMQNFLSKAWGTIKVAPKAVDTAAMNLGAHIRGAGRQPLTSKPGLDRILGYGAPAAAFGAGAVAKKMFSGKKKGK
jgi:superoxide dismutase